MDIYSDKRIVLTLDAGGTNFVFSAIRSGKAISEEITLPANGDNLDLCIANMKEGFEKTMNQLDEKPVAISFAFPGPADYPNGIIGDLLNLPGFRGGVPLAGILEAHFDLPVFINNDGDLYAYGEALGGILPEVNQKLKESGNPKRYHNLAGLTLGTGFGGGVVSDGQLLRGDNSLASEVWIMSNRKNPDVNAEELVSTRAVQMKYASMAGIEYPNTLMPKDIADIARGRKEGDADAAFRAFSETGEAIGDTLANLFTLIDGIIVIGGGITGASDLYMPSVLQELQTKFRQSRGGSIPRLVQKVYNLDDEDQAREFYADRSVQLKVESTGKTYNYNPEPRLAVATSRIGASRAISLGAYAFALSAV